MKERLQNGLIFIIIFIREGATTKRSMLSSVGLTL